MDELAGLSENTRKLTMERFRLLQPHLEQNGPRESVAQLPAFPTERPTDWFQSIGGMGLPLWYARSAQTEANGEQSRASSKMRLKDWRCRSHHCRSPRSIDRSSSSQEIKERSLPAMELSSISFAAYLPISSLSRMKGPRRTAIRSSWCTGEKRLDRMRFGKPIILRSTFY